MRGSWSPVLAALVFVGCGDRAAPPATPQAPPVAPANELRAPDLAGAEPKSTQPEPEFTFTVAEYATERAASPDATAGKYADKRVEITGVVKEVEQRAAGWHLTFLNPDGDGFAVYCELNEPAPLERALPGQTVRLRGTVARAFRSHLLVKDCRIVSVAGEPPLTIQAVRLAQECKDDPKGAAAKYASKYLIVTGEVARIEPIGTGGAIIALTNKGDLPEVICGFTGTFPAEVERNRTFAKGQQVRILGYASVQSDGSGCSLESCHQLPAVGGRP